MVLLAAVAVYFLINNFVLRNNYSNESSVFNKQQCLEAGQMYLKKLKEYSQSPIGEPSPEYLNIAYSYSKSLDTCLISGTAYYSKSQNSPQSSITEYFVDDTLAGEPGSNRLLFFSDYTDGPYGWEKNSSKDIKHFYEFEEKRKNLIENN